MWQNRCLHIIKLLNIALILKWHIGKIDRVVEKEVKMGQETNQAVIYF